MITKTSEEFITMSDPATYRIIVRGSLNPSWTARLGGMNITQKYFADDTVETILVGRLSDQAALASVLNALYELHLPIVSANCLESG